MVEAWGEGEVFAGFRVIRELGKGAMGVVYLAHDPELGKDVALKTILGSALSRAQDPELFVKRFRREAKLATTIKHENVAEAYKFGEEGGTCYLACEFIDGGELSALLRTKAGCVEAWRALSIVKEVLQGLSAFEAEKMIHRDIKPENILLTRDGRVKISDLGLARRALGEGTLLTAEGAGLGTPLYMAPEQILGELDLDSRCDIYAVGALLFHLITGRPPYQAKTVAKLVRRHLRDSVPDLCEFVPGLPRRIGQLVESFMAKKKEGRPASIAAAIAELDEASLSLGGSSGDETLPLGGAGMETLPLGPGDLPDSLMGGQTVPLHRGPESLEFCGDRGDCLSQARLKILGRDGTRSDLFLYGQDKLQLGRNAVGQGGQDVCLRHRPAAGNEEKIRNISGKHFGLSVSEGRAWLRDLASSVGTQLNGQVLEAGKAYLLSQVNEIEVAGNLTLRVTVVVDARESISLEGLGVRKSSPSLYIERVSNDGSHSYALVGSSLIFDLGESGRPSQTLVGPGDLAFLQFEGGLCVVDSDNSGRCYPLKDGLTLSVGGHRIAVTQLRPEHQK